MRAGAVSLVTEGGEIMKSKDEQREETLALRGLLSRVGRGEEEERSFRVTCQVLWGLCARLPDYFSARHSDFC